MKFRIQETKIDLPAAALRTYQVSEISRPPLELLRRHYGPAALQGYDDATMHRYFAHVLSQDRRSELNTRDWLDCGITEMNATFVTRKQEKLTLEVYRGIYQSGEPMDVFRVCDETELRGYVATLPLHARVLCFEQEFTLSEHNGAVTWSVEPGQTVRTLIARYRQWSERCDEANRRLVDSMLNPN